MVSTLYDICIISYTKLVSFDKEHFYQISLQAQPNVITLHGIPMIWSKYSYTKLRKSGKYTLYLLATRLIWRGEVICVFIMM